MTAPLFLSVPGNEDLTCGLADAVGGEVGVLEVRRFPDGETYVRVGSTCTDRDVAIVCTMARPDEKLASVVFAAGAIRDLNARRIVLVAPYLAYLRQDRRFQPGEAVTSLSFATLLSQSLDAVVTIDPHLHRYASLDEVYTIPTFVAHSAPLLAAWIMHEVDRPLLIGPDSESAQWVADVAERTGAPHVISTKIRRGDRGVEISVPDVERYRDCTPVLVDDIISTGRTMAESIQHLHEVGIGRAICVGVHAVFAGNAYETLMTAGAVRVVTCDTIPHATNAIRILPILAPRVRSSFSTPLRGTQPRQQAHEGET